MRRALVISSSGLAVALCSATSASALDCARASTASEKAICADPAALKADAELGKAYKSLLASAPQAERAAIVASEARWLNTRDGDCADEKGAALAACLRNATERRRAYLSGAPEAGPGRRDGSPRSFASRTAARAKPTSTSSS